MTELKTMSIKDALYAPLPVDSRQGRGGTYDYVKWQAVVDRMNEIFGMNWSSHVVYEDTNAQGNIVTVRVAVCAKDPVSGEQYCQEGYGASVLRSSDEAGSAHKGAYSKALKDACKRWGIGLHLEESATAAPTSMPAGFTGYETAPLPTTPAPPAAGAVPTAPSQPVPVAPMMPSAPTNAAPVAPVVPVTPVANHPTAAPAAPAASILPTAEMGLPATPAPAGINPAAPVPTAPTPAQVPNTAPAVVPAPVAVSTADTPGSITSVQDMAIQNLARLNGPEGTTADTFLQGLVEDPECALNRKVTSLNELSYNEAVCVIKAAKSL